MNSAGSVSHNKSYTGINHRRNRFIKKCSYFRRHWGLYFLLLIPLAYVAVFRYTPMLGARIAFTGLDMTGGIYSGKWNSFGNFKEFFGSYVFWRLIKNTLAISFYQLIVGFPFPIFLAIAINEVRNRYFKKTVQMVTYAPYFISTVVMVSMLLQLLSPHGGILNAFLMFFGQEPVNFIGIPGYFKSIYVWSGIWQNMGYNSIIYIAALSSIDIQIYEAAMVDGATKLQRIRHIDIPGILPTAIIMLILSTGQLMNVGFEKTYLMQNDMNISASEVISTYVYKVGLLNGNFNYATAVGLFNSVINLFVIFWVNKLASKVGESGLW